MSAVDSKKCQKKESVKKFGRASKARSDTVPGQDELIELCKHNEGDCSIVVAHDMLIIENTGYL